MQKLPNYNFYFKQFSVEAMDGVGEWLEVHKGCKKKIKKRYILNIRESGKSQKVYFIITKNMQNIPNYNFCYKKCSIETIWKMLERFESSKNRHPNSIHNVYFEYLRMNTRSKRISYYDQKYTKSFEPQVLSELIFSKTCRWVVRKVWSRVSICEFSRNGELASYHDRIIAL